MIGKPLPLFGQKEWDAFIQFAQKCPNSKPVRGGATCVRDGIYGHCDPYGCPKWQK